jgi:hypothetical protein
VVRLTDDGSVIYRAEQDHCRRFPGPASADPRGGPKRNFQVFSALDFLAEVSQHIPDKGEHLVRYYGWYSHRLRGIRAKPRSGSSSEEPTSEKIPIDRSALDERKLAGAGPRAGSISTWAMLTQRVYEVDPLACPKCGGVMKIIRFIERRQTDVIQRILRGHQSGAMVGGLWEGPLRTRASARSPPPGPRHPTAAADELELVIDGDFLESQRRADQPAESGELQWVLDPEFL